MYGAIKKIRESNPCIATSRCHLNYRQNSTLILLLSITSARNKVYDTYEKHTRKKLRCGKSATVQVARPSSRVGSPAGRRNTCLIVTSAGRMCRRDPIPGIQLTRSSGRRPLPKPPRHLHQRSRRAVVSTLRAQHAQIHPRRRCSAAKICLLGRIGGGRARVGSLLSFAIHAGVASRDQPRARSEHDKLLC